ncbi:hypothetical protein [Novosphingobium mangrovi (ex Huang et al. 2023)]|uniref:DUF4129 domain-containing protein n=1 Tax=Novosphingobium mangrovi (ex Huang et al. 2023) TaxID=2976432 RepID=A0ABT2I2J8_9SPHN|nr:hypothetical protein [Novosphingobium mangrovi (ex Huang et al. 2023)]MCT2399030.1 hypothetical protein [Novosphingobium mangrovi (ex Huang et al. 2023)]
MTVAGGQIEGVAAARDAAGDWEAVRRASDIQYAPLPPSKVPDVPQVPEWLKALGRALEAIFGPIGRLLGVSWPTFQWVLIALGALLALFLLWRLLGPLIVQRRNRAESEDEADLWAPDRAEAMALLEDADRLAGEGRYGEATHLLLRRSVRQISDARPDWLIPASTAREIAVLPMLPEAGRRAFGTIAARVERSLFALRDLDAQDWAAARAAYADFALIELSA